jgi:MFS transporter, ACDE family, multidrug resistance protein
MTFRADHAAIWIVTIARRKATVFATLFSLAAAAQTILLTVVPLEALRLLGDARAVSLLYLVIGFTGLAGRLAIPLLCLLIRRRWVFSLGSFALVAGAILLSLETPIGLVLGLILCTFAYSCYEITTNLYVLDNIPRRELGRFEPTRIFFAAAPWALGPWLGVYLQRNLAAMAPYAIASLAALLLLVFFWILRFNENTALSAMRSRPANPLRYLRRFFVQPRLRVAWLLAAGRTAWWSMFFVYSPIFAVKSGLGAEAGGVIVSIGTAWMCSVPLWGSLGQRYGLRRLLIAGYSATGLLTLLAAAFLHASSLLGAALLLLAALGAETIDGAGNSLFLRAVHPYERAEMTAVYATYRDLAQFVPPALFALLLSMFDLASVFVAGGAMMLLLAIFARYISRNI